MLNENFCSKSDSARLKSHVKKILSVVRDHLGMEVAFVSEFRDGNRIFRFVEGSPDIPVHEGGSGSLHESFCYHVVRGSIPSVLPDAQRHPVTGAMPVTHQLPVGAHLSVPIRLRDAAVFGTLCCFSRRPVPDLGTKELEVVRVCAELISDLINEAVEAGRESVSKKNRIDDVIKKRALSVVYQPIYRLADSKLVNFEALSRFTAEPVRAPDLWFQEAEDVGRGVELEMIAVEEALKGLLALPPQTSLSVNLSPDAIMSQEFERLFNEFPCLRVIVELTEHAAVPDYAMLCECLAPYRAQGMRLAIDDVGAGHASFRHILDLAPNLIKLDTSLTRSIDSDVARRTLAEAITSFSRKMGCEVVAEGVETIEELHTLRAIGATKAQGFLLGAPLALADAASLPPMLHAGQSRQALSTKRPGRKLA